MMTARHHRDRVRVWLLAAGATVALLAAQASAQIIDRVLAVVAADPITLSDVQAALRLGLVPDPPANEDRVQAALTFLIERELQLVEVNRYVPPEPLASEIEARTLTLRARFPTPAAFDAALAEVGVTPAQLRARVRDSLRIESYIHQRFGAAYQPGEEEVARYYRAHAADFVRNGVPRPYEEVREDVRTRIVDERAASLVRDWVAGLRRRGDITILPK